MGDQAKIHISLNVSLQNTMGSHAPFFYHAHFRSNEAGIGITRGTVSLSEFSAVIVWYHGTNLSGQHTMVLFQKTVENGQSLLLSLLLRIFQKTGFFRRPSVDLSFCADGTVQPDARPRPALCRWRRQRWTAAHRRRFVPSTFRRPFIVRSIQSTSPRAAADQTCALPSKRSTVMAPTTT